MTRGVVVIAIGRPSDRTGVMDGGGGHAPTHLELFEVVDAARAPDSHLLVHEITELPHLRVAPLSMSQQQRLVQLILCVLNTCRQKLIKRVVVPLAKGLARDPHFFQQVVRDAGTLDLAPSLRTGAIIKV